jgi:hypothetical protein
MFGHDVQSPPPPAAAPLQEWPKQKAWSISAVRNHTSCPLKFRFQRIDRLPEPPQPGGPLERGTQIHAALAYYLTNNAWVNAACFPVLVHWQPILDSLRQRGGEAEKQLAFTATWQQCEWYADDVRARFIFDVIVAPRADNDWTVQVVDWKSGKKYETHIMDARLYALAALKLHPEAQRAHVEFLYVDRPPSSAGVGYACERSVVAELEAFAELFNHDFLNDTLYPARPGPHCNWCYQRKSNGGQCAFG